MIQEYLEKHQKRLEHYKKRNVTNEYSDYRNKRIGATETKIKKIERFLERLLEIDKM